MIKALWTMFLLKTLLLVGMIAGCAPVYHDGYYDAGYPRGYEGVYTDRYGDRWERCRVRYGRPAWCRVED